MSNETHDPQSLAPTAPATEPALSVSAGFKFGEVRPNPTLAAAAAPPSLGPLAAFTGTFEGSGFNTIFRPNSTVTPTHFPVTPHGEPTPNFPNDNVLELNLTSETLSFSASLGTVPNRGMVGQADAFLNGVPYLQTISDVTNPAAPVGIHFEPGMWVIVPATARPQEGTTLVRMASIPHGTTIDAQGTFKTQDGPPVIPSAPITPFTPAGKVPFPSQIAENNPPANPTARIPQDLTSFIAAGTITHAILTDPNTVLRSALTGLDVKTTTTISISTQPPAPLFGGGTDNIAFLEGNAGATAPNANAVRMDATFWIETVEYTLVVPPFVPGHAPLLLKPQAPAGHKGPLPTFSVDPRSPISAHRTITVTATQIQYSQQVFLNFNGLTWPHVSVATLVPSAPIVVPPHVLGPPVLP